MNIGFILCLIMGIMFGALTVVFTMLKEKAAMLISGFNTMPKEQRKCYDTSRMSKDQRNAMLLWTVIMAIGAILSYGISQYFAIIAGMVWLIVFIKDVHIDTEKAFGKYKVR